MFTVDVRAGRSAGGRWNAVSDELYSETSGNCGMVGVVTTTIKSVCKGEGLRRRWAQEGDLVEPRGNRVTTSVHIGRNLAGG